MSFISNLIKDVAPIVATFSTDPVTKAIATGVTVKQQKQEASFQRKLADERNRERANRMAINYNTGFDPVTGQGMPSTTTQNAGQGGFFGGGKRSQLQNSSAARTPLRLHLHANQHQRPQQ